MKLRKHSRRRAAKRKLYAFAGKRLAARLKRPALVLAGVGAAVGGTLAARRRKAGATPAPGA